jgi:hypothetical protein
MGDSEAERKKRADKRRKTMKVRFTTLDDETDPWPVYGVEGISLVTRLTRDTWNLARKPWPAYDREHMPVRCLPHLED